MELPLFHRVLFVQVLLAGQLRGRQGHVCVRRQRLQEDARRSGALEGV
jgi:hypothetical protein